MAKIIGLIFAVDRVDTSYYHNHLGWTPKLMIAKFALKKLQTDKHADSKCRT